MGRLEDELDYYLDYAISVQEDCPEKMPMVLRHIERVIKSYQEGLLQLERNSDRYSKEIDKIQINDIILQYNAQLDDFYQCANQYGLGEFIIDELKIEVAPNIAD